MEEVEGRAQVVGYLVREGTITLRMDRSLHVCGVMVAVRSGQ